MANNDSFDPWIDFLVTDPSCELPRRDKAADTATTETRADAPEARADLELVLVKVAQREVPRALELPFLEFPETEGRRRPSRRRRWNPDWLVDGSADDTWH